MGRKTTWSRWLNILAVTIYLANGVTSLQFTPVGLSGVGDGECALLLNGPGRSSSFDYSLNLLRGGGFGYNGPHTCITYDAVNAAYLEARKRVQVAQPHGDYKAEDVATVGELLLDISVNLARTYGLSYEDIEKGLPLIDTSKTLIREVCPPFLSNVECRPGKYRRFDGLCTNLQNPTWGSTMQPFTRLIGPLYADGMTAPRISVTGNQLPLARVVSRTMHPDEGFHDHAGTVMVIAWGQFIDHDYTLTGTPLDPLNRNDPEECCKRPPHLKNPYCNEILIPEDDYFYRLFNVRCMDFVRGFPAARPGCRLGSRSQFNTLTGVLDANTVYGVSEKFSRKLRSGYNGQLRMNPVFREYGLKDLLPLKLDIPDEGCTRPNRSMYCFEAGEIRVNEQLVLTCMHTLMAREHNRIAEGLQQVNPHWDDETIFQEARRINIAVVQHITYNEFLPILLGKEVMEKFGLLLQKDGYWDGHDHNVNPNVIDAFAAAAYRFGHSLLPTAVERWSKAHKFIASKRLSDLIRRPYDLYRAGVLDEYFMGLMNQVAQAMDDSITQEVTNHLFKKIGARFGMDLVSFNMQRGREFGLPGYMEFRKFCGLPGAESFEELFGSMPNETIKRYSSIFEHPHDVDLWSGGVSERPLPGSMLGPTFACIIATQFSYSRRGDRFWYELPNQPSSFNPEQLKEIRKARMARVICDNTDLIDSIQLYPMVLPDHEINPRVPCRSGVLPSMDFSKWADHGHGGGNFHHTHQPFRQKFGQATLVKPNFQKLENTILKKILASPNYGNVYAPNFKTPYLKSIKILPPLVLKPLPSRPKTPAAVYRVKRNVENITNTTAKNIIQENTTIAPLVDQVTEAITVTQISGNSPENAEDNTAPLNFQPFAITSSDFKNESQSENFDVDTDLAELINQKIQDNNRSDHQKQNDAEYKDNEDEENENKKQREDDNLDYTDKSKLIIHNDELTENQNKDDKKINELNVEKDYVEKNKNENLNNVDKETENASMHNINADEENEEYDNKMHNEKNEDLNYIKNAKNLNNKEKNDYNKEKNLENTDFNNNAKEGINYEQYLDREDEEDSGNNPQKKILVINVPDIPAEEKGSSHKIFNDEEPITDKEPIIVLDNFEKHIRTLRPKNDIRKKTARESETENEDNIEYVDIPVEREVEEKEKYFDDIISHQLEANQRLQHELEYPDLDNEYEAYRKQSDDHYLGTKAYDFENVAKPYNIQLRGDFPFEKELQDRNYNDDVDEGSDKMRYNINYEYLDEVDVPQQKSEKQLKVNNSEEEADELTNSAAEEQENDETEDLKILDAEDEEENNDEQSSEQKYRYLPLQKQKSKINQIVKELEELTTIQPKLNFHNVKNTVQGQITINPSQPETVNNVLKSILSKRDAISRQQNVDHPETYNTFWSLLYKNPRL